MRLSRNAGQTLIEVIVAAGLVVLVLTTLASGLAIGIRNNRVARDQATAKEYVRQSLESLRNIRDQAGWETFYAISKTTGPYCLTTLPTSYVQFNGLSTGACSGYALAGQFKRELLLTKPAADTITAVSTVTWEDGAKTFTSTSTLNLYQWK